MKSYESPCGVMRVHLTNLLILLKRLRIPMRGYEAMQLIRQIRETWVTNPHAGL